jgi:hypothetical protein
MKVKVLAPFQVAHAGSIWRPGDVAEVPDDVGEEWLASGWVTVVKPVKKAAPKRA